MAYIGLRKPFIASMKEDGKYEAVKQFARAIQLDITPNYAEGSLYCDDAVGEEDKIFNYADITLGTDTIPLDFRVTLFGNKTTEEEVVFNIDDIAPNVGMGIIKIEKVKGVKKYVAAVFPKCKFTEPSESVNTKGESITYNTPSIAGKAFANDSGDWKLTKVFTTEAEAIAYIKEKLPATV